MWKRFRRAIWLLWDLLWSRGRRHDELLIVTYLAERGPDDVLGIGCGMKDFTLGREDWLLKRQRSIYRALDRLEADGTLERTLDYGRYKWRVRAPKDKLLRIV